VPEEINRKIIDHLADINMTLTEHARRYLIAEGIPPETIIKTGSGMKEVLHRQKEAIDNSDVLIRLNLTPGDYFVLSAHREENIDSPSNFQKLSDTVNAVAQTYGKRIIVSTHPRTQKKIQSQAVVFDSLAELVKPLGFADYIKLQQHAFCVLSDSGTITEEASLLGFPAITLRQAHERPEGMDEGALIMSGLKQADVLAAIRTVTGQYARNPHFLRTVGDYETDNVSAKVVRIILSYTDYVRRTVWREGE
jgi:UDP-N-acetylglucosamine 2-epimerase (non-hydrolysing)